MSVLDRHERPLRNLRLSVTDRCNLRCAYCMPEESYVWLPRPQVLDFEEMSRLVDVFITLGVDKVRLTGGEPLLRRDLPDLVRMLAAKPALADLALTSNGLRLADQAHALHAAGLHRITVSLDTLRPERFFELTRRDSLHEVVAGLNAVNDAGFRNLKIDTVVIRGTNDDELEELIDFGTEVRAEVRFIEYMDVGGATRWSMDSVVARDEVLARLAATRGPIEAIPKTDSAPADRYRLADGTVFGVISSTTAPFCGGCDRSRLTADGMWYLCLYAKTGTNLRDLLRDGASDDELRAAIRSIWTEREDRGAEDRLLLHERGVIAKPDELRDDPHFEMHTRGG